MQILMIVGSEMGSAEMVGDLVKDELEDSGHEVELVVDGELDDIGLGDHEVLLVVTSTTGLGEVPQNIEPIYEGLVEDRPDLSHLRYGVIGMGDRNYKDTFCGGPRRFDAVLNELGATRVGDPLELDATDQPMPDEDAVAWLPSWLARFED
ncbi:MAG: flavodoxin domain-containing protein [Sandaracinaceae bacterium]